MGGDLVEEPRRRVVRRRTPGRTAHRPGDVEPFAGAGDADVGEASLLLQLGRVAERAQVGEHAVLEPGEEDDGELQPLGGVQRHQRDHAVALVGDRVGVGDERDLLEERLEGAARQVGLLAAALLVGDGGRVDDVLARDGDELGEVLHAGLVLRVLAVL